jgi:hypothetical protein
VPGNRDLCWLRTPPPCKRATVAGDLPGPELFGSSCCSSDSFFGLGFIDLTSRTVGCRPKRQVARPRRQASGGAAAIRSLARSPRQDEGLTACRLISAPSRSLTGTPIRSTPSFCSSDSLTTAFMAKHSFAGRSACGSLVAKAVVSFGTT